MILLLVLEFEFLPGLNLFQNLLSFLTFSKQVSKENQQNMSLCRTICLGSTLFHYAWHTDIPVVGFLSSLGEGGGGRQVYFSLLLTFSYPCFFSPDTSCRWNRRSPCCYRCVCSLAALSPPGHFEEKTNKKHQKKKKKKEAVTYILYDPGGSQSLLMMGYSCQFLFLKTLFSIRQSSQEFFVLINLQGNGILRGVSLLRELS